MKMFKLTDDHKADEVYLNIHVVPLLGASAKKVKRTKKRVLQLPVQGITEDHQVIIGGRVWLPEEPSNAAEQAALKQEIEDDLKEGLPDLKIEMGEMIAPGIWRVFVGEERCVIRAWIAHYFWVRLVYWVLRSSEWDGDIPDGLVEASHEAGQTTGSVPN
jgi:hypothetical protein